MKQEISYTDRLENISVERLTGFFVGWDKKPSPEKHLELLKQSDFVVLATNTDTGEVVGFITAITDKTLAAYIPFLEVLPGYQSKGIGTELMKRMLEKLKDFYIIDLFCDPEVQKFYEKLGMQRATGMIIRNRNNLK